LDPARPALVVIAMGTTFKGVMDDQSAIRKILRAKHRGPVYIHLDAAPFGGFLPYVNEEAAQLVHQQAQKFGSILVSGHKFFGFDEPIGVFICTREATLILLIALPGGSGSDHYHFAQRPRPSQILVEDQLHLPGRISGAGPEQLEQCRISPPEPSGPGCSGMEKPLLKHTIL
jgi:hypothetical protein